MSSEIFQLRNRGQLSGPFLSAEVTWTLERSECLSSSQDGGMMEGESLLLLSWVSFMLPEYHTTQKNKIILAPKDVCVQRIHQEFFLCQEHGTKVLKCEFTEGASLET